eukprot:TRINITY_DN21361_c0_g1_i1.p1 TRINITY_DN21361_c0_g1~~TRINITY_DN21361_c0_g1_i1.p1  ORF type:complete len:492 (+),score=120.50 TRINITY_DN21361_c0_g1_i1:72-1478(+)
MGEDNPLVMFKDRLLKGEGLAGIVEHGMGPEAKKITLLCQQIYCPEVSSTMFSRTLQFLVNIKLIPPPDSKLKLKNDADIIHKALDCPFYRVEEWIQYLGEWSFKTTFFDLQLEDALMLRKLKREVILRAKDPGISQIQNRKKLKEPLSLQLKITDVGLSLQGNSRNSYSVHSMQEGGDVVFNEEFSFQKNLEEIVQNWKEVENDLYMRYQSFSTQLKSHIQYFTEQKKGVFIRISTRSPKDAIIKTNKLYNILQELVAQEKTKSQHIPDDIKLRLLTRGIYKASEIQNYEEALWLLLNSDRIFEDFRMAQLLKTFPLKMAIREFTHFSTEYEFRAFVFNTKLTCATAYHQYSFVPELLQNKAVISSCIISFWESNVRSKVPFGDYTIDLVLSPSFLQATIIEINYPPPISSTILFDWNNPEDNHILLHGPYQLRLVQHPQEVPLTSYPNQLPLTWITPMAERVNLKL